MTTNNEQRTKLFNRLVNLIENNKQGFTANNKAKLLNLNKGYAISITNNKDKRISKLINNVLNMNKPLFKKFYYGYWFNESENKGYLDITLIEQNKNTALQIAKDFNQKAIFSFKDFKSIDVLN